jgi:hypothetical protein
MIYKILHIFLESKKLFLELNSLRLMNNIKLKIKFFLRIDKNI